MFVCRTVSLLHDVRDKYKAYKFMVEKHIDVFDTGVVTEDAMHASMSDSTFDMKSVDVAVEQLRRKFAGCPSQHVDR